MFNLPGEKTMCNQDVLKVEIHVTEHCNLKCICCEHFSSIAKEDNINIEDFEGNLKKLFQVVGEGTAVHLYILGGEPTLHPELRKLLEKSREIFSNRQQHTIRLVTNGLLLPDYSIEFWKTLKNNDIIVSVSKYPTKFDYERLEHIMTHQKVKFEIFHSEITKYMRLLPMDLNGTQEPSESFATCPIARRCCFLKDYKIYSCPRIPNVCHFNNAFQCQLDITENDYLDINTIDNVKDIWEFLDKPNNFCKYCDVKNTKTDVLWQITTLKKEEWVL